MPKYTCEHQRTFLNICTSHNSVPLPCVLAQPYKLQCAATAAQWYRICCTVWITVAYVLALVNFPFFISFFQYLYDFNILYFAYTCVMLSRASPLSLISKMTIPVPAYMNPDYLDIFGIGHLDDILSGCQEKQQTAFYYFCPFQFHLLTGKVGLCPA